MRRYFRDPGAPEVHVQAAAGEGTTKNNTNTDDIDHLCKPPVRTIDELAAESFVRAPEAQAHRPMSGMIPETRTNWADRRDVQRNSIFVHRILLRALGPNYRTWSTQTKPAGRSSRRRRLSALGLAFETQACRLRSADLHICALAESVRSRRLKQPTRLIASLSIYALTADLDYYGFPSRLTAWGRTARSTANTITCAPDEK